MCEWRPGIFAVLLARGFDLELIWYTAGLVALVFLGVVIIVWVDRWRKRSVREGQGPADDLSQYQALFEQGLLSAEEYERIRRRLEQRPEPKPPEGPGTAPAESAGSPPLANGPPGPPPP